MTFIRFKETKKDFNKKSKLTDLPPLIRSYFLLKSKTKLIIACLREETILFKHVSF
ncbi:hypothetical protein T23_16960 [Turicibacter faecis]|uniref:Uncharacterized protein n=1 Tax=Turicibacter faecis TaxID=2963365 RepID=A0ABM8IK24_9FIRM|nr:hypothetical protein T23_16960 [Turicibacter sp. TC023]